MLSCEFREARGGSVTANNNEGDGSREREGWTVGEGERERIFVYEK